MVFKKIILFLSLFVFASSISLFADESMGNDDSDAWMDDSGDFDVDDEPSASDDQDSGLDAFGGDNAFDEQPNAEEDEMLMRDDMFSDGD